MRHEKFVMLQREFKMRWKTYDEIQKRGLDGSVESLQQEEAAAAAAASGPANSKKSE